MNRRMIASLACATLMATAANAQQNDLPLNNGAEVTLPGSNPSVGGLNGDLFWKVLPGDRVLAYSGPLGQAVQVSGFHEGLFDTDWSTSPDFYDRLIGPALPSTTAPGNLEPAFLQLGGVSSETLVVVGNSGFGNPCTIVPSLCSPPGGTCPPTGIINGYVVDLSFSSTPGSGIIVPADGTPASDLALTFLFPDGMSLTGGPCGLGDYSLQNRHSTDETQADDLGGISAYDGFQLAGGGPIPDAVVSTLTNSLAFREPILNVRADSGTGLGVETSDFVGGGATNGLKLSLGGDPGVTIGMEIHHETAPVPNLAVAASALSPLPLPGLPLAGGRLYVAVDALFLTTASQWQGVVVGGTFVSSQLPVGAGSVGLELFSEGFVLDLSTLTGVNTNRVRTSLLP